MDNLETLYLKLPIPLQQVICSLEGWRLRRSRFSGAFPRLLGEAERRGSWSMDEMNDYRDERLRAFVRHCVETVPFYRQRFKEWRLSPHDIRTLDDLRHLPVLNKQDVQDHMSEFISTAVPQREQIIAHTSGTTGGGLRFNTTLHAVQEHLAVWWRYRHWHGLDLNTWCGYFGGRSVVPASQSRPPFWRYNYPGRQILFSGYHMSPANINSYLSELRTKRPPWLHGYPSLLALLANHVQETGDDLSYRPRWITTGAENLLPRQADLIERALGVRPRQHYSMAEAVANISECELGALHVDEDFAAVELLPDSDGAGCKVVGTNLANRATPLLRYGVADTVSLSDKQCACGRPGRMVATIDGRIEDYIVLRDGTRLGRLDHIFKDMINVREAQLYQARPGQLLVRIVRGNRYTDHDECALLTEISKRVGDRAETEIEYVEVLERSRAGKLRFVVSEPPEAQFMEHTSATREGAGRREYGTS